VFTYRLDRYNLLSQEEEDSETTDEERDLSAWSAVVGAGKKGQVVVKVRAKEQLANIVGGMDH
jgi:hypothetical protein